jgi:hypothetical protein
MLSGIKATSNSRKSTYRVDAKGCGWSAKCNRVGPYTPINQIIAAHSIDQIILSCSG